MIGISPRIDALLRRLVVALESIAGSLEKIARPLVRVEGPCTICGATTRIPDCYVQACGNR